MKELSIEEKARAYDKAIEIINDYYQKIRYSSLSCASNDIEVLEKAFPQLKESEDERIRGAIIDHLKDNGLIEWADWLEKQGEQSKKNDVCNNCDQQGSCVSPCPMKLVEKQGEHARFIEAIQVGDHVTKNEDGVLVNLSQLKRVAKPSEQNQGEQKPADKVEPKFHEGDWVVAISSGNLFKIISVHNGLYKVLCEDGIETNYPFKEVDKDLRLWTIQDAKDGDVLATNSWLYIFKYTNNKSLIQFHCNCPIDGKPHKWCFSSDDKYLDIYIDANIHPATKEQRNTLFEKMREAGYEWDAEKKELKKIEQKPAWSEEDERIRSVIWSSLDMECLTAHGVTYEKVLDWFDSLKDKVLPQPKQEWSEEDEEMIEGLLNCLDELEKEHGWNYIYVNGKDIKLNKVREWLKPQNWTKEDKERYISCLQKLSTGNPEQPETINSKWFKEHVYPQNRWKPSEEQMKALSIAMCGVDDPLFSLYNDLKKLKE